MKQLINKVFVLIPLCILCLFWEYSAQKSQYIHFLFSSPSNILEVFLKNDEWRTTISYIYNFL